MKKVLPRTTMPPSPERLPNSPTRFAARRAVSPAPAWFWVRSWVRGLLFFALIFLIAPKVSAEIKEGKSTVNTSVTTNVDSSSNNSSDSKSTTKTHIEIEVNGEKKVLDTSEPGTHTLSIEKDGGKSSATVKINNNVSSSNQEESEEGLEGSINGNGEIQGASDIVKEINEEQNNVIQRILNEISKFFKSLFKFF